MLIPHDRCLPLIRNTDAGNILRRNFGFPHRFYGNAHLCCPYFQRVMLHPARLRINLPKFFLGHTDDLSGLIK